MCCTGFIKTMMIIFNGIIFLAGGVILGVGVWLKVDGDSVLGALDQEEKEIKLSQLNFACYLLIALGAVLLLIGFLGCCGAIRESRCMLLTFFSIILIIFLIEVAGAVLLFLFQSVLDEVFMEIKDGVGQDIRNNYGEDDRITSSWNINMKQFKCCGFNNYTDFVGSPFAKNGSMPLECCNSTATSCYTRDARAAEIDGCFDKLLDFMSDNALIVAGVCIGIAALEIAAMVASMVLYCRIGEKA